ncbi:thioredoxin domain-containing protein [Flavobacterium sp. GT3R68]|uniref:thioredoxin domain-containing protein n=1 Tax=Flavobacterium sp. GT3R68 TaxID=2594437 RepID=UPI000F8818AA|nr:thioredoxin domain-containing protein [Flavobacterium sp. GT3R68]RTY93398.1 redoxin domain-containing protein [Flavobacterium sp. GSN2]TRW92428.1 redoxin domain-containing protein [Flavobacterium sp. GT3R68]
MRAQILTLFFITFFISSCNGQSQNYESIPATAFAEKIKTTPKAQILDVRTLDEYASGHIENADNINWNSDSFVAKTDKYDKSKPVFVYCMSGGRSKKAADKLHELGFKSIYELQGGILKWNAAGFAKPNDKIIGMCSQEYAELLNSDKKVLINFYAPWCAPCKKMEPYILQMQKNLSDKVTIIRLNADENKTLLSELKIDELPTILIYQNKEVKWKHSGFITEEDLTKQL